MMDISYLLWIVISATIAAAIGLSSYKKKSLSKSGLICATIVGFVTFSVNALVGSILIAFFLSSSRLTKFGSKIKQKIEHDYKIGGQRTAIQVISNSASATLFIIIILLCGLSDAIPSPAFVPFFLHYPSPTSPILNTTLISALLLGAIAHYACCCADTWSSEIGSLSAHLTTKSDFLNSIPKEPFLITTFKPVPTGTNGGVSFLGLFAGIAGGLFIGFVTGIISSIQLLLFFPSFLPTSSLFAPFSFFIPFGIITGLLGTLLDSFLGALCQCSVLDVKTNQVIEITNWKKEFKKGQHRHICGYPIFDNHQVNLISSSMIGVGVVMYYLL
jgi:uncharacterized membrane protein